MGLYENIRDLAKTKGYSINRLEQELGFARSSINKFNKNTPSTEKIQQIADLLGVTVDSLLHGTIQTSSEMVYERIENLRKSQKISQGTLEKELGFSNGSISKWKNSMPTSERLQKIADYFGVSMEYLMTGYEKEENKQPELSNVYFSLAKEAEQNGIDPRDIKMAIEMLKKIREEEKNK